MTMDFIIEFHIDCLFNQTKAKYQTRMLQNSTIRMLLYTWLFLVHVHCTDWPTTLLMKTNQEIKQSHLFNQRLVNVLFLNY